MRIDVWSDVVCPFCYIGKRRLEAALEQFPHKSDVEVFWHSFELDPNAPVTSTTSHSELLAGKYGMSLEQVHSADVSLTAQAAGVGLDFHLAASKPANSFDAHRLVHFAAEHGLQDAMKERLLRAYFTDGEEIGDPATLLRLATEVGLDPAETTTVLQGVDFADDVRGDEQQAREIGITGVPFFVLDQRLAISGAQPAEVFSGALDRAWAERSTASA